MMKNSREEILPCSVQHTFLPPPPNKFYTWKQNKVSFDTVKHCDWTWWLIAEEVLNLKNGKVLL